MLEEHLVIVNYQNEVKIAQEGLLGGNPLRAGNQVLNFLRSSDLEKFKKKLKKSEFLSDDEHYRLFIEEEGELSRQCPFTVCEGVEVLTKIQADNESHCYILKSEYNYVYTSHRHKWADVIDFDDGTFEIYEGLNTKPLYANERFYNGNEFIKYLDKHYYSIKLLKSYSLDNLPTIEEMINELNLMGIAE